MKDEGLGNLKFRIGVGRDIYHVRNVSEIKAFIEPDGITIDTYRWPVVVC